MTSIQKGAALPEFGQVGARSAAAPGEVPVCPNPGGSDLGLSSSASAGAF